jgi:hypothetical protein
MSYQQNVISTKCHFNQMSCQPTKCHFKKTACQLDIIQTHLPKWQLGVSSCQQNFKLTKMLFIPIVRCPADF